MKRRVSILAVATVLGASGHAAAAPKLKVVGRVNSGEAAMHDAFALDQAGSKLAYIVFTGKGRCNCMWDRPGARPK